MERLSDILNVDIISDILEIEVVEFSSTYIWGGVHLKYSPELKKEDKELNIHELMYITKNKIAKKGYTLNTRYIKDWWDRLEHPYEVELYELRSSFSSEKECYAVFKAYKWLYNKEQKELKEK